MHAIQKHNLNPKQNNLKWKSLGLKIVETIAIMKKLAFATFLSIK